MKSLLEVMRDKCKEHKDCEYRDDKRSFPYAYECEDCMMRCELTVGDIETTEKESKKDENQIYRREVEEVTQ